MESVGLIMYYFISFANEDRRIQQRIRKILFDQNIKYWADDSEINLGDDIKKRISTAIQDTSAAIIVVSKASFKSKDAFHWCKYELSEILKKSANTDYLVLPVFLEPIDEIRNELNTEDKNLLNEISGYHGLKVFDDHSAYKRLEEYLIDRENSRKSIIEDENGYYCYWGTEFGQISISANDTMNYLFIDTVHSDKGREYVIMGKFELLSHPKLNPEYNSTYHITAMKLFSSYLKKNKQDFHIVFSDKSVLRKEFAISTSNEKIEGRFTGRVNGIFPFGMNVSINYEEILTQIE